ncbi:MAG: hypothetical protein HYW86_01025 [Candidatus Roizmanbacteria bacterium]|nr:MAG: hypothetical protein HYW86_01025 [Candidatus Roizmanbacteria bacterium]
MARRSDKGVNPLLAGIVGTVAGAAGAAATIALTDEKARRRMGDTINDIKDQVVTRVKEYTEQKPMQSKRAVR